MVKILILIKGVTNSILYFQLMLATAKETRKNLNVKFSVRMLMFAIVYIFENVDTIICNSIISICSTCRLAKFEHIG